MQGYIYLLDVFNLDTYDVSVTSVLKEMSRSMVQHLALSQSLDDMDTCELMPGSDKGHPNCW